MTAPARRLFLLAPLAGLVALLALACGGGGSSTDEAYLRALCTANNDLESVVLRGLIGDRLAGGDAPDDDPAETLAAILDPVGDWIEALRAATPPDDVAAFHEAVSGPRPSRTPPLWDGRSADRIAAVLAGKLRRPEDV